MPAKRCPKCIGTAIVNRDQLEYGEYSLEDVSIHNTPNDVWIIIHGRVYEVTTWLENHPGHPEVIQEIAGKDVTKEFESIYHSMAARHKLAEFEIGSLYGYTGDPDAVFLSSNTWLPFVSSAASRANRIAGCNPLLTIILSSFLAAFTGVLFIA
jgi:cytochrome b involved in lipid metabolism